MLNENASAQPRKATSDEHEAVKLATYVHTLKQGLQAGLSRFYGRATKTAVVYSPKKADWENFLVYDTLNILPSSREFIRNYFANAQLQTNLPRNDFNYYRPTIVDNLCCFQYQLQDFFYQMWIVETPQSQSSLGILEQWVRFSLITSGKADPIFSINGRTIEHAAFDVIRESIMLEMFPRTAVDGQLHTEVLLDALMEVASTKEEGSGCNGSMVIFDKSPITKIDIPFRHTISIKNHKHVRKLLTATNADYQRVRPT